MTGIKKDGFTLIEILVTITVITILIAITAFSYTTVQVSARDSTRKNNVTIISTALEKYWDKNGEYPSEQSLINSVAGNTGTVVAAKLGVEVSVLDMPKMPAAATNAITATDPPANDYVAYVALPATAICQTTAAGGCTSYTLKYIEEASGTTVSVTSRH